MKFWVAVISAACLVTGCATSTPEQQAKERLLMQQVGQQMQGPPKPRIECSSRANIYGGQDTECY